MTHKPHTWALKLPVARNVVICTTCKAVTDIGHWNIPHCGKIAYIVTRMGSWYSVNYTIALTIFTAIVIAT